MSGPKRRPPVLTQRMLESLRRAIARDGPGGVVLVPSRNLAALLADRDAWVGHEERWWELACEPCRERMANDAIQRAAGRPDAET